jgi:hypothetical protein
VAGRCSRAHARQRGVLGQEKVIETRVTATTCEGPAPTGINKKVELMFSIGVHLVGNRSLSGPFRDITKTMEPRPLIGARSLPVQKKRNFFFCSKLNICNTCHSKRMVGCPLKYLQQHNDTEHRPTPKWRNLTRLLKWQPPLVRENLVSAIHISAALTLAV